MINTDIVSSKRRLSKEKSEIDFFLFYSNINFQQKKKKKLDKIFNCVN